MSALQHDKNLNFGLIFLGLSMFQGLLWVAPLFTVVPRPASTAFWMTLHNRAAAAGWALLVVLSWILYVGLWDDWVHSETWARRTFLVHTVQHMPNALVFDLLYAAPGSSGATGLCSVPNHCSETTWFMPCLESSDAVDTSRLCSTLSARHPINSQFNGLIDLNNPTDIVTRININRIAVFLFVVTIGLWLAVFLLMCLTHYRMLNAQPRPEQLLPPPYAVAITVAQQQDAGHEDQPNMYISNNQIEQQEQQEQQEQHRGGTLLPGSTYTSGVDESPSPSYHELYVGHA